MIRSTARAFAVVTTGSRATRVAGYFRPHIAFQLPINHHSPTLVAESEFGIAAVNCRVSTAARLNPDARFNALTLHTKAIETAVTGAERIFNALADLAPFAVVDNRCHLHCLYPDNAPGWRFSGILHRFRLSLVLSAYRTVRRTSWASHHVTACSRSRKCTCGRMPSV